MTNITHTTDTTDLRLLLDSATWFATIALPARSDIEAAEHRLQVQWHAARRALGADWSDDELAELDAVVADVAHAEGEAFVIVHGRGGATIVEAIREELAQTETAEGPEPRLARVLENRRRSVPHVVVDCDHTGAEIVGVDAGGTSSTDTVEGATLHIHRGHPGGWSQHRFQQRAVNTWEHNAREVAEVTAHLAARVQARLIAVAGNDRSQSLVLHDLPADLQPIAVRISAGAPDRITDEVDEHLRLLLDTEVSETAERIRAGLGTGLAGTDEQEILEALENGRVETLLVHDDGGDEPFAPAAEGTRPSRLVDVAIAAALRTDAAVVVAPTREVLGSVLGAVYRW
jgi:hypothetical protein